MGGADGIVNLAGKNLFENRWKDRVKGEIKSSRVEVTRALVEAMRRSRNRPKVLVNASAIGYYGPHGDEELDESSPAGNDFLSEVATAWEEAARQAEPLGVRVVRVRIGVVLGRDGGALPRMAKPFRWFVGGRVGSGEQWLSWIHIDDLVGIFRLALERGDVTGAVNGTAPEPQKMRDFCSLLGAALGRPSWFPVPGFMLRLALGEVADILLAGQNVMPAAAERYHYPFRFGRCESALRDVFTTA